MSFFSLTLRRAVVAAMLAFCIPSAQAASTVLTGFTLIDGTGSAPVPFSALIIGDDGRIAWLGSTGDLVTPTGAQVVDLTGKFLLPGLIDGHVHVGIVQDQVQDERFYTRANVQDELRTYAAYGVTSVAVYGTDKDLIFDIRKEQRAGRSELARIFTAGKGIVYKGGYGGVLGINRPVANVAEAIAAVDREAMDGADFIKFWMDDEHAMVPVKMPYDISGAIISAAHRHHLKAVAHLYYLADAKKLVAQGVDGFAHQVRDQPVDQALLDAMVRQGTWQAASTLSRDAAFSWAIMPFLDDPFFQRGVTPGTLAVLRSPERERNVVLGSVHVPGLPYQKEVFADYDRIFWQSLKNFAAETHAGVAYGMGTDSGAPGRFPGFNAHEELQLLVMDGLTPMQAIVAATSRNAQWLAARDIGTVAAGKWADLLVLEGNPLEDIRNTHKIAAVYVAGTSVPTVWQICRGRPVEDCSYGNATRGGAH